MKSALTNEYCLTYCLLRGQFFVLFSENVYGFTKSVKGYEVCSILKKTSKQVALLGKILQLFSENVVCFTKSDWNLPHQRKITNKLSPWGNIF